MKYILSLKYSVSNNVIQVESTETINEITIQEEDEENIENYQNEELEPNVEQLNLDQVSKNEESQDQ